MDRILKVQPAKELKLSSAVIPGLIPNPGVLAKTLKTTFSS
jgi:hypothetical protein